MAQAKDVLFENLQTGDIVMFTQGNQLKTGLILKLNYRSARVKWTHQNHKKQTVSEVSNVAYSKLALYSPYKSLELNK